MEATKKFCTMLLLESPTNVSIGFDNLSLKTGELFKGIKEIPQGPHFLHTTLKIGKSSNFFYFSESEIMVLKWDTSLEEYLRLPQDDENLYSSSINEFLPMMVKYPEESLQAWNLLTNYITKNVITRLEPLKHSIFSADKEYDLSTQELESFATSKSVIYYTPVPKR